MPVEKWTISAGTALLWGGVADRLAAQAGAAVDRTDREQLDPVHAPDLRPLLHIETSDKLLRGPCVAITSTIVSDAWPGIPG